MLSKELRLKKASDFAYIAKKGSVIHTPFLSIKYLLSKDQDKKFGIVISAKVSKSAVVRNLIKRQIRHCVYKYKDLVPAGARIFIQVKAEFVDKKVKFSELERIILIFFTEIANAKNS